MIIPEEKYGIPDFNNFTISSEDRHGWRLEIWDSSDLRFSSVNHASIEDAIIALYNWRNENDY